MSRTRFVLVSILFDAVAYNAAVLAAFLLRFASRSPRSTRRRSSYWPRT